VIYREQLIKEVFNLNKGKSSNLVENFGILMVVKIVSKMFLKIIKKLKILKKRNKK
jgi:hypothetical protein